MDMETVVQKYIELRNLKTRINDKAKAETAKVKEKMDKLEAFILQQAEKQGVDSFKTKAGTAFVTSNDYAKVADWDSVLEFIKQEDAYDLLDHRVNKTAIRSYIDEHDTTPPGVDYGSLKVARIRKAQ